MTYALVIFLAHGAIALAHYDGELALQRCTADAQRITARDRIERRDAATGKTLEAPTYPGFVRAHCERVSR